VFCNTDKDPGLTVTAYCRQWDITPHFPIKATSSRWANTANPACAWTLRGPLHHWPSSDPLPAWRGTLNRIPHSG